jgi:hypothetical protein
MSRNAAIKDFLKSLDNQATLNALASILWPASKMAGFEKIPLRVLERAFTLENLSTEHPSSPMESSLIDWLRTLDAPIVTTKGSGSTLQYEALRGNPLPAGIRCDISAGSPSLSYAHLLERLNPGLDVQDDGPAFPNVKILSNRQSLLSSDDRLSLLHEHLAPGVIQFFIEPDVVFDRPIVLVHHSHGVAPLLEINAAARSRATFIHVQVGSTGPMNLSQSVIHLHENSHLRVIELAKVGPDTAAFHRFIAEVHHGAHFEQLAVPLTGKLVRTRRDVHLLGQSASTRLNAVFAASAQAERHLLSKVQHHVKHSHSEQLTRGLGFKQGVASDISIVEINPDANGSQSTQSSRHLLLDPSASIEARPVLEIFNNDVKASHGATVGTLDPLMSFYLRSRGIDPVEAQRLLQRAFWHEAMLSDCELPVSEVIEPFLTNPLVGLKGL